MSARALRLYVVALVTVAIASWWQLPAGSLRAQAAPPDSGVLFGAGSSIVGQLGLADPDVTPPRPFPNPSVPWDDVADAAIGTNHSLVLRADGSVWGVGSNQYGQIGGAVGNGSGTVIPALIPGLPPIVKVAAGGYHSVVLDDAGGVWTFGLGAQGQLGDGGTSPSNIPIQLPLSNVIDIAAGEDFTLAVQSDGTILGWGNNQSLQLGTPFFGLRSLTPVVVPKGAGFLAAKVAAKAGTALALSTTGQVMGWGANFGQQLGSGPGAIPTTAPFALNIKAIAVGSSHILLVTTSGTVLTRGTGTSGQLGNGTNGNSAGLITVPGLSNVVSVAAGQAHSLAVRADGSIWAWGSNQSRQLGIGSAAASVNIPTQVSGVPMTARRVEATGISSFFLLAPGEIAVTTKAPSTASCSQAFNLQVTMTGYNNVGVTPREIVLVLDESGSISQSDFASLKTFAQNFVNTLDISPTTNRVGVVMFSASSRTIINLSSNKSQLLTAIGSINQATGQTCIGCGISTADTMMDIQGRAGADRTMVVVTDGINNVDTVHFDAIVTTAQQSSTLFAIGVGAGVDPDQIDFIASDIPGVKTSFLTTDFASLSLVISELSVDVVPALTNVTLHVLFNDNFAQNGNVSATSGTVSAPSPILQWSLPTLGAAPATITIPLLGTGHGGSLPLVTAMFYSINSQPNVPVPVPEVMVTGCPAQVVLNPPSATHTVGAPHNGTVNVLDDFGSHLSLPTQVVVSGGPNAGRVFNIPATGSVFVYSSNLSGTDTLSASVAGYLITASATVQWDPVNTAPVVNAGGDQVVHLSGSPNASFTITGSATDDGLIEPLSYQWTEGGTPIGGGNSVTLTRGLGVYTFVLTANDGALNGSDSVKVTVVDPTPPLVSPIVTGPSGSNGWYTGPVSVTWKVVDHESTITTPLCEDALLKDDGANQIVACFAESDGGKTNASTAVNIDSTPPLVTVPASLLVPAIDALTPVTYSGDSATDATSGIASSGCSPASGSMFPVGPTIVNCTATDAAGNSASDSFTVTVAPASTSLQLIGVPTGSLVGNDLAVMTLLNRTSAPIGPLTNQDITFTLTGPSGTTQFTATTNAAGNAFAAFPLTARGVYSISAAFGGKPTLKASSSATVPINVYQRTVLVMNPATGIAGSPTTVTATLLAVPQNTPIGGQPVTISSNGNPLLLVPAGSTDANGVASTVLNYPAGGSFTAAATFSNLFNFFANSNGAPVDTTATGTVTITTAATSLSTLTLPPSSLVGGSLTISTMLSRISPAGPLAGMTVAFTLTAPGGGTTQLAATTDANGVATATFSPAIRGVHTVSAQFAATSGLQASSSNTATVSVYQRTMLALAPATGPAGSSITLVATLVLVPQGTPLSGQVVDISFGGAAPSVTAATDANGVASASVTFPDAGAISALASFSNGAAFFTDHMGSVPPLAETATAAVTVTDSTPPVITKTITGQMGNNGWFIGDVSVTFTVNDPETAFTTSGCDPTTISSDGAFSIKCTASSVGGSASSTATGKRDATAPSVSAFAPVNAPATSATGAIIDSTGQSAQDATSGIDTLSCAPASHIQYPIGTTTVTCTATDRAGNSAAAMSTVTVSDTTPPVVTPNVSGTIGGNGWFTSDVIVSFTATDPETAVTSSAECSAVTIGSDGSFTRTCTATSGGGSTTKSVSVKRDTTGPVVTTSPNLAVPPSTPTGANVNYAAATASDATSGAASVSCAPASGTFFPNGTSTVSCTAIDNAGNSSSASFTITVNDTVPPVITNTSPSESSLWPPNHQMVPITITIAATDNLGPAPVCSIASVSSNEPQNGLGDGDTPNDWLITGPKTVQLRAERAGNGNGRVYTVVMRCLDGAGNAATSSTTVSVSKAQKK